MLQCPYLVDRLSVVRPLASAVVVPERACVSLALLGGPGGCCRSGCQSRGKTNSSGLLSGAGKGGSVRSCPGGG